MRHKITETPLQKAYGTLLRLKINVGSIIVDPTDKVDSRSILKQAEQNLEQSLSTDKNYSEITEVTTKSL